MSEKMIIKGFIKCFNDEQAVIDCAADRKIVYLYRLEIPANACIGDFIIYDSEKKHCCIDCEITRLHEQELQRLSDSYFG